jgi:hypothetical protein
MARLPAVQQLLQPCVAFELSCQKAIDEEVHRARGALQVLAHPSFLVKAQMQGVGQPDVARLELQRPAPVG